MEVPWSTACFKVFGKPGVLSLARRKKHGPFGKITSWLPRMEVPLIWRVECDIPLWSPVVEA